VESFLALVVPRLMRYATARQLGRGLLVEPSHVSPLVTAITFAVYPLVGAIAGGLAAAIYLRVNRAASKDGAFEIPKDRRRQIGGGSLAMAVVAYLLATQDAGAMTVTAIVAAVMILDRFFATGPISTALLLVGVPILAEPRALPAATTVVVAAAYAAAIVLAGVVFRRFRPGDRFSAWMHRPSIAVPAMTGLACVILAVNLAAERSHTRVVPPVAARAGDQRPNVILISLDTVRADHLSVYGYGRETTPGLKRLAARSTVYTRALATSNFTLPSHASMLTGLSTIHHGARDAQQTYRVVYPISPRVTTAAEALAREGYLTGAVVANFAYLVPEFGFGRGFASYQVLELRTLKTGRSYLLRELVADVLMTLRKDADGTFERGETVTAQVQQFLDTAAGRQPFFLFVNYMDAHHPYRPPAPYDTRFPGKDASFDWSAFPALVEEVSRSRTRGLRESERQHLLSQYDGALAYLDDQLERVFSHLRALGVFDNSLIIITSDHGEAFDENGIMVHGTSLYDHQIHVPLIVKYPNASMGAIEAAAVSGADVMPTILDVAGVPPVAALDGRSLRRLAPGDTRPVISESYKPHPARLTWDGHLTELALSAGSLKLILRADGGEELYDLSSDPVERTNLIGRRSLPEGWAATLGQVLGEARRLAEPSFVMDPAAEQRLRSLGYIR
jgi:arylsulfatase A-like enzyme